ncbi:RNase P/RNase MRP complex subunit, partial [Linderina pennispora]
MSVQDSGIYAKLSETIKGRSGAPTDVPVDPVTKQFTPGFVERSMGPNVRETPTHVYNDRVNGRALLLTNPFKESPSDKGRVGDAKLKRRANRKTITAKEKRALKIYDIPEAARKYELFLPLHEMWNQYMSGLIGNAQGKPATMLNKIVKADMHGAEMTV